MTIQKSIINGFESVIGRIVALAKQPKFIALTILGNSCIIGGALAMYHLEHPTNPHMKTVLDAIWWAFSTVTTVGYGDIIPMTTSGKVLGIFMMVGGTGLFCSYTALFASALMSEEIDREVREIEREVEQEVEAERKVERAVARDEKALHELIVTVEATLESLKQLRKQEK
jgi:voltage-gated potassium channel